VTVPLVALALAAACSGGSTPQTLPSLTPTPSASGSVLLVTVPASAKPATPIGAAAFVRFYFESLNEAYRQGVRFPVADLSAPTCKSCASFASVADLLAGREHHFLDDTFVGIDVQAPPIYKGQLYVSFTCALPARKEADASGNVVKRIAAEPNIALSVVTVRVGNGWRVKAMTSS
jgi:hypothetical protein